MISAFNVLLVAKATKQQSATSPSLFIVIPKLQINLFSNCGKDERQLLETKVDVILFNRLE